MQGEYEIEIKSLLGSIEDANALKERMRVIDSDCFCSNRELQKNHYFTGGSLALLFGKIKNVLSKSQGELFQKIYEGAATSSLRTRETNGKVLLVIKATVDDTSSENGTSRLELEVPFSDVSLADVDQIVRGSGFSYQAKWSRERETYAFLDIVVCIDKNAGYGFVAEFEIIESDSKKLESRKEELRDIMNKLGVEELPQDRLERMFAHYNDHWEDYYGTNKTFCIQ